MPLRGKRKLKAQGSMAKKPRYHLADPPSPPQDEDLHSQSEAEEQSISNILSPSISPKNILNSREQRYSQLDAEQLRLSSVIGEQFDMEIILKHRELNLIEGEIAKVRIMMDSMRQRMLDKTGQQQVLNSSRKYSLSASTKNNELIYNNNHTIDKPRTSSSWHNYKSSASRSSSSSNISEVSEITTSSDTTASSPPIKTAKSRPANNNSSKVKDKPGKGKAVRQCFYERSDGHLVQMICPECGKEGFANIQGFINHCRLSHKIIYESHEAAAKTCGIVLEGAPEQKSTLSTAPEETGEKKKEERKNLHLSRAVMLKGRDLDFEKLVSETTSRVNSSDEEEDEEETDDEDTINNEPKPNNNTFNRLASEAKRMNLDIEEILKSQSSGRDRRLRSKDTNNNDNNNSSEDSNDDNRIVFKLTPKEEGKIENSVNKQSMFRRLPRKIFPSITRSKARYLQTIGGENILD